MNLKIVAAITSLSISAGTPSLALSEGEREELFFQVESLCRFASSVGEVLTVEGDLEAGAILRLIGGRISGRVDRTSWENINQIHGDYRNDPTICRREMVKELLPLFSDVPQSSADTATYAGPELTGSAIASPELTGSTATDPNSGCAAQISVTHGATVTCDD